MFLVNINKYFERLEPYIIPFKSRYQQASALSINILTTHTGRATSGCSCPGNVPGVSVCPIVQCVVTFVQ